MDISKDRFLGIPDNISGLGEMACNLCGYTLVNLFHVPAIVRHFVGADLRVCPNNGRTHRFAPTTGLSNIYRTYWFMVF